MLVYRFRVKYLYFKRIIPLIIIAFLLPIVFFAINKGGTIDINAEEAPKSNPKVTYIKDNKLYFINNEGKSIFLCDNVYKDEILEADRVIENDNQNNQHCVFLDEEKTVYFYGDIDKLSETGTLYKYTEKKGVYKIDENVRLQLEISPDHNKIAYKKLMRTVSGSYDLYIYELNKGSKKILENITLDNPIYYGWDNNSVCWIDNRGESILYIKNINKNKEIVDRSPNSIDIMKFSNDGKLICYSKTEKNQSGKQVYFKNIGGMTDKISQVENYSLIQNDFSFFYTDNKDGNIGNLYFKALNKKAVKIDTKVNKILYYANSSKGLNKIMFQKFDKNYYIADGKNSPRQIQGYIDGEMLFLNNNANNIIGISQQENEIKEMEFNKKNNIYKIKASEKNVISFQQNMNYESNKNMIFYEKANDNNFYDFYCINLETNKKEKIQDSTFIVFQLNVIGDNGRLTSYGNGPVVIGDLIYYCSTSDSYSNLYEKKAGKQTKMLVEKVCGFSVYKNGSVYYCTQNSEGKFSLYNYKTDGSKKLMYEDLDQVCMGN